MKQSEIRVGGLYLAKVSDKVVTVRVDRIRKGGSHPYEVTNLATGRKVAFKSAAKFRAETTESKIAGGRITGLDVGPLGGLTTKDAECAFKKVAAQRAAQEAVETSPPATPDDGEGRIDCGCNYDADCKRCYGVGWYKEVSEKNTCSECGNQLTTVDPSDKYGDMHCPKCKEVSEEADPTMCHTPTAECVETADAGPECEGEQRSDPMSTVMSVLGRGITVGSVVAEVENPHTTFGISLAEEIRAARRKVGDRINGWVPSAEQEAILRTAAEMERDKRKGRVLVIAAGAGCAKTSTDLMLEQVLEGSGQYTAFNKKLTDESKTKFKKARVNTTHSLAYGAVGKAYQHRLPGDGKTRMKSGQVAALLGISDFTLLLKGKGAPLERGTAAWDNYAVQYGFDKYSPPMGSDGEALLEGWEATITRENTQMGISEDGDAIVLSIVTEWGDETQRGIYADWLEENVSEHHANFVRNPHGDLVKNLPAAFIAGQVMKAIDRFCQSADHCINESHIYSDAMRSLGEEGMWKFKRHLLPFVLKAWEDIVEVDGVLPFNADNYVKMWQLGTGDNRPIIPKDYILLDEGQDTAPVFLDILARQQDSLLIIVGDDNQQIYEWRGAVNALSFFKGAPRLTLSQSYRYGQTIADVANAVLGELEEPTDLVLKGNPEIPSRIIRDPQQTLTNARCYLYRSNAGAVGKVMEAYLNGQRPHLVGKCDDIISWCVAALDLQQRRKTAHYDLGCFDSWGEVVEYSKTDEGADLRLMVKMVNQFGADNIIQALRDMPKEQDADLVVSTAHKAKGLEWDTVKLGHDFPLSNKMMDSDRRLLYVALTRAKMTLDISDCPPFCGGNEWEDSKTSMSNPFVPGLSIVYTVPMPTEQEQRTVLLCEWMVDKATKHCDPIVLPGPVMTVRPVADIKASTNGKFTWTNFAGKWCVRGPAENESKRVKVERKDGSTSDVGLGKAVKKYDDAWIYQV